MYGTRFGVEMEATGQSPEGFIEFLRLRYPREVEVTQTRRSFLAGSRRRFLGTPSAVDFTQARRVFTFRRNPDMTFAVKSDSSIQGYGAEIVSPPMTEESLPFLKNVIKKMKEGGLKGHKSAGLHVHVSPESYHLYDDRNEVGWAHVLYDNWRTLMPKIKKVWRPYTYRLKQCKLEFSFEERKGKYHGFNTDHKALGTIEYRLFNSVLDYRWVCRAIRFACSLTRLSLEGVRIPKVGPGRSMEAVVKQLLRERGIR